MEKKKVNCSKCVHCRCKIPVNNYETHSKKPDRAAYGRIVYTSAKIWCDENMWQLKGEPFVWTSGLTNFMEKCKYAMNDRECSKFEPL